MYPIKNNTIEIIFRFIFNFFDLLLVFFVSLGYFIQRGIGGRVRFFQSVFNRVQSFSNLIDLLADLGSDGFPLGRIIAGMVFGFGLGLLVF